MIPTSLRLRGANFAFLFGPPRFISREEAAGVHGAICDSLKVDDFAFLYKSPPVEGRLGSKGFVIDFQRSEGRGGIRILLDNQGIDKPIRLLIEYTWPGSPEHAHEIFDIVSKAVFSTISSDAQTDWQKTLAEVRLRAQCTDKNKNALGFILNEVLKANSTKLSNLGEPLLHAGISLEVASRGLSESSSDSLLNPQRVISFQILREDPQSSFFFELMSQWPQLPQAIPKEKASLPLVLRPIDRTPSEYTKEAYTFLTNQVISCFSSESK